MKLMYKLSRKYLAFDVLLENWRIYDDFLHCSNIYKVQEMKVGYRRWKMKTNEEKMNEELTELYMNYEKERKRIEIEIKDKGLWETFGLDANEHFVL